jgi:hypothetical protein
MRVGWYAVKGWMVIARDWSITGILTGSKRNCPMEGCNGLRVGVRWEDGRLSFPCTCGMEWKNGVARIL